MTTKRHLESISAPTLGRIGADEAEALLEAVLDGGINLPLNPHLVTEYCDVRLLPHRGRVVRLPEIPAILSLCDLQTVA